MGYSCSGDAHPPTTPRHQLQLAVRDAGGRDIAVLGGPSLPSFRRQPDERAKLLELFRVLRATRARMDGTIGIEQVSGTSNPEPTFTPSAFTPLPSVRAPRDANGSS
jgi:hypothetical protein